LEELFPHALAAPTRAAAAKMADFILIFDGFVWKGKLAGRRVLKD